MWKNRESEVDKRSKTREYGKKASSQSPLTILVFPLLGVYFENIQCSRRYSRSLGDSNWICNWELWQRLARCSPETFPLLSVHTANLPSQLTCTRVKPCNQSSWMRPRLSRVSTASLCSFCFLATRQIQSLKWKIPRA